MNGITKAKDLLSWIHNKPDTSNFDLESVYEAATLFYCRHPLAVGTRVIMIKTPDINEKDTPGWMHSKHFLKKGALGEVTEIYVYKGKVRVGVIFDDETWLDKDGTKNPVSRKGMYTLNEDYFLPIEKK